MKVGKAAEIAIKDEIRGMCYENGKLYMNDNSYIGKIKQELLESLKTSYKAQIEEI